MSKIIFYEKPGCINGEKQKNILLSAGNSLECINILTEKWQYKSLLPFVKGKAVQKIMNYTAPQIKSGEINPDKLSFDEAMDLMIANPILIKRPLIMVESMFIQGFDDSRLTPYLGGWDHTEDVITCPKLHSLSCDEKS